MAYTGGDIIEVTYSHPTVGSGILQIKSNEDTTVKKGGFMTDDDASGITGGGEAIYKMSRTRWEAELGPVAWDMTDRDELTKLQEMASSPLEADWTFGVVNGAVWSGKGKPVGDIAGNTNAATIAVKLAGGGTLSKQA